MTNLNSAKNPPTSNNNFGNKIINNGYNNVNTGNGARKS